MQYINPQQVLNNHADPLCLSISLQMINCTQGQLHTQTCKQFLAKHRSELGIFVWHNIHRNTIHPHYLHDETCATSHTKLANFTRMKWTTFAILSTTTMMESCCLDVLIKPIINSMEMTFYFHSRIRIVYNKPHGCLHSTFTYWQSKHLMMNLLGCVNVSTTSPYIRLGRPTYGFVCDFHTWFWTWWFSVHCFGCDGFRSMVLDASTCINMYCNIEKNIMRNQADSPYFWI